MEISLPSALVRPIELRNAPCSLRLGKALGRLSRDSEVVSLEELTRLQIPSRSGSSREFPQVRPVLDTLAELIWRPELRNLSLYPCEELALQHAVLGASAFATSGCVAPRKAVSCAQ